jgi:hypothetical protein
LYIPALSTPHIQDPSIGREAVPVSIRTTSDVGLDHDGFYPVVA